MSGAQWAAVAFALTCAHALACRSAQPLTGKEGAPTAAPARAAPSPPVDRDAALSVVRIDDESQPFLPRPQTLPAGLELREERVGWAKTARMVQYACALASDAAADARAKLRLSRFLGGLALPAGRRFVPGLAEPPSTKRARCVRAYVLSGEAIVTGRDVVDARVQNDPFDANGPPQVAMRLSAEATQRFHAATRAWLERRIAIVVDGTVRSAPVVLDPIAGGRLIIVLSDADRGAAVEAAERLVRRLRSAAD